MVYELWDTKFDIEKLREHLRDHVLPLEITSQTHAFGGWSVLSSNGSHKDGWHQGHKLYAEHSKNDELHREFEAGRIKLSKEYTVPTEICHGYLLKVISTISEKKLKPCRARIIRLVAGGASAWHRDAADNQYGVRLHIPIQTNPSCFFEVKSDRAHLPADGSAYFLHVNRLHRVVNGGETDRYHLVIDVKDEFNVTQFHRYEDFLKQTF